MDIRFCGVVTAVTAAFISIQASAQLAVTPAPKDKPSWTARFEAKKKAASSGVCEIAFIGDSITHNWEKPGRDVWNANYTNAPYRAINFGISADRTENVLWRIRNGQLDGISPKAVVIMIGTNNTGHRSVEDERPLDTVLGVQSILEEVKKRLPSAVVILHPIFPRGATKDDPKRVRNDVVNAAIKGFADGEKVFWCDFNSLLLTEDGVLEKSVAGDLLHPGPVGYEIWAKALKPYLDYALGRRTKKPRKQAAKPAPTALDTPGVPKAVQPAVHQYWLDMKRPRLRTKRAAFLAETATNKVYDAIWLGDSITHFWEREGNREVFQKRFAGYRIFNCGFGGDHVCHLLWNIKYGGFLDGVETKIVSLMIGTNNMWNDSVEDVVAGIKACLDVIREKQPNATVLLHAVPPREVAHKRGDRDFRRKRANVDEIMPKHEKVNSLIRQFADGKNVVWVDITKRFTDEEGLPDIRLLGDGTHPNAAGCNAWADEVLPFYRTILGR